MLSTVFLVIGMIGYEFWLVNLLGYIVTLIFWILFFYFTYKELKSLLNSIEEEEEGEKEDEF